MLKKIALCASVLTLSALVGGSGAQAYDAPANSFYPAAGWDVSKMQGAGGAGAYCMLLTEYNNGFFVQFQGRDGALDVIGIDLRQPAFQEGQNVEVTLTIPGKTSLKLNGKAFNKEVVTLDMSGQDTLLDMLRSASAMDIEIEGSAFRFFLTGFTNAVQGFDRCNQGAPQTVSATEQSAPVEVPEEEVVTMEEIALVDQTVEMEEEEPASNIAIGEPVRTAPSENMRRRQEKEQEIYESEIARIMPREERVTADLQKQMEESGQTLSGEADMEAAPQKSASRFTEQLAQQMGTAVASQSAEPVRSISAERMAARRAPAEPAMVPAAESGEVIDLTTLNEDAAGPAVIETAAIQQDNAASAAPTQDDEGEDKSLMAELQDFVSDEPETAPPPQTIVDGPDVTSETVITETVIEPDDKIEEPIAETEIIPAPPVREHVASTPEMKVTRSYTTSEADFTDIPVDAVPAVPPALTDRRVSELEAKLSMLQRENDALNAELEMSLRSSEQERLEISSDNWNLEQATMRYNEAERQIAKLGQQVQKERAQCAVEKKELEMMLFDPQVTEEAQLGHLAKLEDELDAARAEIETLRAQLGN